MRPSNEWLKQYAEKSEFLAPKADLNEYFELNEMGSIRLDRLKLGSVNVPTGEIIVADPLVYLPQSDNESYFVTVPPGVYPLAAAVAMPVGDAARYAAVRLEVTKKRAERYVAALIGDEALNGAGASDSPFFGFTVDAGLGSVVDKRTYEAYLEFTQKWNDENPGGNIYDDYFAEFFAASYRENPRFQRKDGDWINWTIPGTDLNVPMFQSGFGDGAYPVYWGLDADGEVCCLVIHFIDIEMEYGE